MIGILRLPLPALAAAGFVLTGLALAPATAAASCGDYVVIQEPVALDQGGTHDEPVVPVAPCRGPECSKAPSAPALPLTGPVSSYQESEQPSAADERRVPDILETGWRSSLIADARPVHVATSIFHPPRTP